MTTYLLAIAVGPVQDFIAAARRTRDLWYGSFLLSEISKAVARTLSTHGELIFPAPLNPLQDLEEGSAMNVSNVIVIMTNAGEDPKHLSKLAEEAARDHWRSAANQAMLKLSGTQAVIPINQWRWAEQLEDVVQCYAAWVSFNPEEDAYLEKRKRLMRLLAGRKACRDFVPTAETQYRLAKSSLDGSRETIFDGKVDIDAIPSELRGQLRLTSGEQLDAVGLTKRMGGDRHGCPSVSTIAVSPWARGSRLRCPDELMQLIESCESLVSFGLGRAKWPQYESLPFEGTVGYQNRHHSLKEELKIDIREEKDKAAFDHMRWAVGALEKIMQTPSPYLVIMAADGDRMGAIISELVTPEDHRRFSQALSLWATEANQVIAKHFGWPVYVGGDDVLAFVPLDTSLHCAQALHDGFASFVGRQALSNKPTLSVGLAIVGFQEPMELSLNYARQAERAAKGTDRDGLAIHYHPGSGAPILVRGKWGDGIADRLKKLTVLHRDNLIGDKAAYDLRELSRLYENWPQSTDTDRVLQADVGRLLSRKPGAQALPQAPGFSDIKDSLSCAQDVVELANQVIITRLLGKAQSVSGWSPANTANGGQQR